MLELFLPAVWSVGPGKDKSWSQQVGSWALPVLSLLVLLALCDGSRHGTLALVDITDAHPLPVNGLLPQGHLQASTRSLSQVCAPAARCPHLPRSPIKGHDSQLVSQQKSPQIKKEGVGRVTSPRW